jgi:hypothetical protein
MNPADQAGQTPLHLAFACNSPQVCAGLVRNGGNLSIADNEGARLRSGVRRMGGVVWAPKCRCWV